MAVASPTKTLTPLDKMRAAFPDLYQKRNGFWANKDNPKFDAWESPEGNIRITPWTGRSVDNVLSMGKIPLTRANLFAKGVVSQVIERDKLDLLTLSHYMKIPWEFLLNIGYNDGYSYEYPDGRKVLCVQIGGYNNPDSTPYSKNKVRVDLHKEPRFLWDAGSPGPAIPCGLDRLVEARSAGYLVIGEGESDAATCWYHGLPFLGISGASTIQNLDVGLLAGIPAIYIIEEPDQAHKLQQSGQGFYKDVRKHLRANGYAGAIFSIRFEDATGYKDPSDLHKAIYAECKEQEESPFWADVHARFVQVIEAARETAIPEGNESPRDVQARQEELNLEEWLWQAVTAKKDALSDRDIKWCIYLCLYMRKVERGELGHLLDYEQIAFDMHTDRGKVSEVICYLADKVGLFVKHTLGHKEYIGDTGEFRYKGQDVYITPTYTFKRLRGACAPLQDQHMNGGPREKQETKQEPVILACDICDEPVSRLSIMGICDNCDGHETSIIEVDASNVTIAGPILTEQAIESTAAILPLANEEPASQADSPVTPKLGYTGNDTRESNSNPQTGVYGKFAGAEVLFPLEEPAKQSPPAYDGPYPPPNRQCICCRTVAWRWNPQHPTIEGGGYECAACHPERVEVAA